MREKQCLLFFWMPFLFLKCLYRQFLRIVRAILRNERPPRDAFLRERPRAQGSVETTRTDANSKRFYSDTQVPGATKSLGGLARRQAEARGFYRRAKARVQKRDAWLQEFHWSIQIRLLAHAGWQILGLSPK